MRKIGIAIFVLLLACAGAMAFSGSGYPAWDGETEPDNGLNAKFGDERIALNFDPTPDYSFCGEDQIQACFFAYDKLKHNYLELYLLLPLNISAGDILQSEEGSPCSVSLYEVNLQGETLHYAGRAGSGVFPEGSRLEIHIEQMKMDGDQLVMNGRLQARMGEIQQDVPTGKFLELSDALFCFSLSLSEGQRSSSPTSVPQETPPALTQAPAGAKPVFTLPPDYRVI